ncbi:MAG: apolipoprotein N-acyltransferase [Acidobacteriota bacterium]
MPDVRSTSSRPESRRTARSADFLARIRSEVPSLADCGVALISAALLIVSFPNFDLSLLAWIALVPVLLVVARAPRPFRSFYLGWLFSTAFFYGSCYWLTYSMIHTGGLSPWVAFALLLPATLVVGVFPAVAMLLLARAIRSWGTSALFLAPILWPALEWARLETTGQLWNAIGYSQAYHPLLIRSASWGGVYAVGFLVVLVNVAVAFALLRRTSRAYVIAAVALLAVGATLFASSLSTPVEVDAHFDASSVFVIAIQPNVPVTIVKSEDELQQLTARHLSMSESALQQLPDDGKPRLVIWPESPMNFSYGSDNRLRDRLATFAKTNKTSVLLNSQELAPNDGIYNSALLINEEGKLVAQYDKIRLLPFGEYVPLPDWLPGVGLIRGIVGDFTPGTKYQLMVVGTVRAGVFICIESAYPAIVRTFSGEGADVLINISNDGYLGPTAVMRQHLANAVFRAVENGRPLLRVTNTGITASISPAGEVQDATEGFKPEVRVWTIAQTHQAPTFYTKHGDLFVVSCTVLSLLMFALSFRRRGGKPLAAR